MGAVPYGIAFFVVMDRQGCRSLHLQVDVLGCDRRDVEAPSPTEGHNRKVVEIPPASRCSCKQKFDHAQNDNDERRATTGRPYGIGL